MRISVSFSSFLTGLLFDYFILIIIFFFIRLKFLHLLLPVHFLTKTTPLNYAGLEEEAQEVEEG